LPTGAADPSSASGFQVTCWSENESRVIASPPHASRTACFSSLSLKPCIGPNKRARRSAYSATVVIAPRPPDRVLLGYSVILSDALQRFQHRFFRVVTNSAVFRT